MRNHPKLLWLLLIPAICLSQRVYEEKSGVLVIEAEHAQTPAEDWGDWTLKTNIANFTGEGHIEFDDGTMEDRSPGSELKYQFIINTTGNYSLHFRAHKRLEGAASDKCNDAFVRMEGNFTSGNPNVTQAALERNTKLYGGSASGWGWAGNLDGNEADHEPAQYSLIAGETYTFYIVGRSVRFNIDRIVFEMGTANWQTAPESGLAPAFDHIDIDNSDYRIALSYDGNAHDKDDILAMPLALAIIHHAGVKDKFVFMDYSNHIWEDDGNQPAQMRESIEGACERWGFDQSKTFEVRVPNQYQAAKDAFKAAAVDAYEAGERLYYACGGPMEVPYQLINQLDTAVRENITVVSHSDWNNVHASKHGGHDWSALIQIAGASSMIDNQNQQVWNEPESNWAWLQQENDDLNWLFGRNFKNNWDGSDAGMVYYIVTGRGDDNADMSDAKDLFRNGPPFAAGEQDDTPPEVGIQINAVEFGFNETITVTADITDPTSDVLRAELYIDDAYIGLDTEPPYEFSFPATLAGSHAIYVKGIDVAYNTALSETIQITVASPKPEEALVAHYPFDGDLIDAAGDNDGKNLGDAVFETGHSAQAVKFDGNDAIEIPKSIEDDFTIAFWMHTTETAAVKNHWWGGLGVVDAEVGGYESDFGLSLLGTHMCFGLGEPGEGDVTIVSTSDVNDGQWHHVAATRNSATGIIRLYVDGALEASDAGSKLPRKAPSRITVGCLQVNKNYFKGMVDELYIYNAVFGDSLIAALAGKSTSAVTEQVSDQPVAFRLDSNYPNPFNMETRLSYQLPEAANVSAAIYDVRGAKIRDYAAAPMSAGVHTLAWNGLNDAGHVMVSGIYYLQIRAESVNRLWRQTQKLTLLK